MSKSRVLIIRSVIVLIVASLAATGLYLFRSWDRAEPPSDSQEVQSEPPQIKQTESKDTETIPPEVKADFTEYTILIDLTITKQERLIAAFEGLGDDCFPNDHWAFTVNPEITALIDNDVTPQRKRFVSKHEDAGFGQEWLDDNAEFQKLLDKANKLFKEGDDLGKIYDARCASGLSPEPELEAPPSEPEPQIDLPPLHTWDAQDNPVIYPCYAKGTSEYNEAYNRLNGDILYLKDYFDGRYYTAGLVPLSAIDIAIRLDHSLLKIRAICPPPE